MDSRATLSRTPRLHDLVRHAGLPRGPHPCVSPGCRSMAAEPRRRVSPAIGLADAEFLTSLACSCAQHLIRGASMPARGALQRELGS